MGTLISSINRNPNKVKGSKHFVIWDLPRVMAAYERAKVVLASGQRAHDFGFSSDSSTSEDSDDDGSGGGSGGSDGDHRSSIHGEPGDTVTPRRSTGVRRRGVALTASQATATRAQFAPKVQQNSPAAKGLFDTVARPSPSPTPSGSSPSPSPPPSSSLLLPRTARIRSAGSRRAPPSHSHHQHRHHSPHKVAAEEALRRRNTALFATTVAAKVLGKRAARTVRHLRRRQRSYRKNLGVAVEESGASTSDGVPPATKLGGGSNVSGNARDDSLALERAAARRAVDTVFLENMFLTRHQFWDVFTDYSVTTPSARFLSLPMPIFEQFKQRCPSPTAVVPPLHSVLTPQHPQGAPRNGGGHTRASTHQGRMGVTVGHQPTPSRPRVAPSSKHRPAVHSSRATHSSSLAATGGRHVPSHAGATVTPASGRSVAGDAKGGRAAAECSPPEPRQQQQQQQQPQQQPQRQSQHRQQHQQQQSARSVGSTTMAVRDSGAAGPTLMVADGRELFLLLALLCNGTHEAQIRFAFNLMDADESGRISETEVHLLVKTLTSAAYRVNILTRLATPAEVTTITESVFAGLKEKQRDAIAERKRQRRKRRALERRRELEARVAAKRRTFHSVVQQRRRIHQMQKRAKARSRLMGQPVVTSPSAEARSSSSDEEEEPGMCGAGFGL